MQQQQKLKQQQQQQPKLDKSRLGFFRTTQWEKRERDGEEEN